MRGFLLSLFLMYSCLASADLTGAFRYDYIQGKDEELANRALIKSKLNSTLGPFGIFVEGFAEFESNEDQAYIRRSPSRGYLQEAYIEFKLESFYVRVGRQALRWSESWSQPSLDIWTGRRYNRLYFDPISEQFTHPTGASFSYASESFSFEAVGVGEVAENIYPVPIPETSVEKSTSFGGRAKWDVSGFSLSALAAQVLKKDYYGLTGNYAFDLAVPKIEIGHVVDRNAAPTVRESSSFATLGCDLFLGNWIVFPQVSSFEVQEPQGTQNQTSYYVSTQWNPDRHDVQFQFYRNAQTEDTFVTGSYGYNVTDYFTATGFVQNYAGKAGLYNYYEDITGGLVFGVRMELTGNWAF